MRALTVSKTGSIVVLSFLLFGCPGSIGTQDDGGQSQCLATQQSGLSLVAFGPVTQSLPTGGTANVRVLVARGSEVEGQGSLEVAHDVDFEIVNPKTGVSLDATRAPTGADGTAQVTFSTESTAEAGIYQVRVSSAGTCDLVFTLDVNKPLRQLRLLSPNPFDTFTFSRIPITVEASTDGNAKLANEDITFTIDTGGTAETTLGPFEGAATGNTFTVKTDANGLAIAMFTTGTQPLPGVKVVATMTGTADAEATIRVNAGTGTGCTDDFDCPLSYYCKSGLCEPPVTGSTGGCIDNSGCQPPTICDTASGDCLEPTGAACDPIEGIGCQANEVCIGNQCAQIPGTCSDTGQCPPTWVCQNGTCQPPNGGCQQPSDCPQDQTCITGNCIPTSACNIPHAPDRLAGNWQMEQKFDLRDALGDLISGLLSASETLRDIIEGRFGISGLPSFVEDLIRDYLQTLINQYIPPWGQQLIIALGDISDILDDMRVISIAQLTPTGTDSYSVAEQWQLVEFEYKGQLVSQPPSAIPQIGNVTVKKYLGTEVCGKYFMAKHTIKNAVAGLIKWAIETTFSIVSCGSSQIQCYGSIEQALAQVIDCGLIAIQLESVVQSVWGGAPPVSPLIQGICDGLKTQLINELNKTLGEIETKFSLLKISGVGDIASQSLIDPGSLSGSLGTGLLNGNFHGTFKMLRAP